MSTPARFVNRGVLGQLAPRQTPASRDGAKLKAPPEYNSVRGFYLKEWAREELNLRPHADMDSASFVSYADHRMPTEFSLSRRLHAHRHAS